MLELRNLTKRYSEVVALDGLSFDVRPGELCGFVGRNGAGKTTAMRIVLGLADADEGEVLWRGAPLEEDTRRRFGYMPEERGLYPKMRVLDHLVHLGRLGGMGRDAAECEGRQLLEGLGLADRARNRVQELSLGNQQRVQLAAALLGEPDVLILDEPFSGVDPIGVDALAEALTERAARGVAVMFSSHQLDLVERLCDAVVIIERGRVVAAGAVDALRNGGRSRLVRVGVAGATEEWAHSIPGVHIADQDDDALVLSLDPGVDEDALVRAAVAAGRLTHWSVYRPTLTELFREVVTAPDKQEKAQ